MSKLCNTCIYRNNVEQLKPCIIYRDDCEYYEKERGDMTREEELDWLYRLRSEIYVYMPKEWLIPMNNALDMAIKALEEEPKTGHWINIINKDLHDYRTGNKLCFECSECRSQYTYKSNYCPNCGARMEESDIHCNHTDTEIAKSFIEDVEAVKDLLPQESEDKV